VNKHRTYKAFTLVELLLAMAIGLLIIAMAYMAFLFLTQRFIQQKKSSETITNTYRLKDLLSWDYQRAHTVKYEGRDLFLETNQSNIIYKAHPEEQMIMRILAHRTDTFWLPNQGFQSMYEWEGTPKVLLLSVGVDGTFFPIVSKQSIQQQIRSRYEN